MISLLPPFQSLSIQSMKSVRGKSLRSSGGTRTTASTQTAASVFTTGSEWSPWTWSPRTQRRPAPGSLGWNTSWLVSATKTVWPGDNEPVINILYSTQHAHVQSLNDTSFIPLFHFKLVNQPKSDDKNNLNLTAGQIIEEAKNSQHMWTYQILILVP